MARDWNTDKNGRGFDPEVVGAIWRKGETFLPHDLNEWRFDKCGYLIRFSHYGNTKSVHGWEIDHIKPVAKGGSDEPENLQPLQWKINRDKADKYPWSCP
ncbi:MAG: HNH endonuclease [Gammaproteobacteria bacterium AqS3]|nr:HNH endonuclease [Gammaproteobacteria bacterium AqS3]